MELLNKEEHLNCYLYDNQSDSDSIIVHFDKIKGERFLLNEIRSQIVFLLKGKISVSCTCQINYMFEMGNFLIYPQRHKHILNTLEN